MGVWFELAPGSADEPTAYGRVFTSNPLGLSGFHVDVMWDTCDLVPRLSCFFWFCLLHVDHVPGLSSGSELSPSVQSPTASPSPPSAACPS